MRVALGAVLLALVSLSAFASLPAQATADIEVRSQAAANRFPDGIQFSIVLGGPAEITAVRLRHRVLPDGVNVTTRATCNTGSTVSCNAQVGSTQTSYMVPGAEVVYFWEAEDSAGNKLSTPEARTTYQDTRFQWQSISDGNLTVYFYVGDATSNQTVLRTSRETFDRIGKLEGTTVTTPVKVWVYGTARDLAPAVASRQRSGPQNSVQTLGEVGASDTALVSRDTDFLNIVRHELAHIVTREATRGQIAELPVWINEGISTYTQNQLLPGEQNALETAIRANRTLPITSLGASARGSADVVSLFYAQSGSIIKFMIEKYGEAKFAQMIAGFKNDTADGVFKAVYGFDQLGLENEWRKSVGLPPVDASSSSSAGQTVEPTRVPLGSGSSATAVPSNNQSSNNNKPSTNTSRPASNSQDEGGSSSKLPIIMGVIALCALFAGGAGVYLAKKSGNS